MKSLAIIAALVLSLPAGALEEFPKDFPQTLQAQPLAVHEHDAVSLMDVSGYGGDGGSIQFDVGNKYLIVIPGKQGKADGGPGLGATEADKKAAFSIQRNTNNDIVIRTVDGHVARIGLTRIMLLEQVED